ncbi:hypothetical protein OSB04_007885 [Centaurea solstitialis]|uniref:Uncharacterized protein n=1 Tax=Centaurea solstitialis TaxID=347529 RepID=A0AA38TKQ0_9ASTR|nr:hypothetical protein OSB04_007885 [Centaurea solstitialis]
MDHSESFGKLGWLAKVGFRVQRGITVERSISVLKKKEVRVDVETGPYPELFLGKTRGCVCVFLRVWCKLKGRFDVLGEIDHRGSSVIAFLTQVWGCSITPLLSEMVVGTSFGVFPVAKSRISSEFEDNWGGLAMAKTHISVLNCDRVVSPGRLKGRAWLEVPISQEAQFCLVVNKNGPDVRERTCDDF